MQFDILDDDFHIEYDAGPDAAVATPQPPIYEPFEPPPPPPEVMSVHATVGLASLLPVN